MYRIIIAALSLLLISSCKSDKKENDVHQENLEAKKMIQGIWMDDATDTPLLRVKGDSIYYSDTSSRPVGFKIIGDTLFTYGTAVNGYKIEKINQYSFWFKLITGDVLQLTKTDNSAYLSAFNNEMATQHFNEVIKKDSVIMYNNTRYRGYVYINPSKMKVMHSELSDEGISVDNEFYDNIIHICVYEGKKKLCSKDINKNMFHSILPKEFLQYAILSDMDFVGANAKEFQYQCTICIPNDASCYLVNVIIDKDSNTKFSVAN